MNWFFVENLDCFDFAEGDSFLTSADGYFFPIGLDMKSDGSALYYMANSGITKQAVTHSLTAWDLSTEAFVRGTDFSSEVSGSVRGCAWGDSGDFFYISTTNGSTSYIYRFACSTPYDTSTKGTKTSTSISTSGFSLGDIFWKPDGTKLFVVYRDNISGGSLNKLASINLNTAWDITDISSTTTASLNTSNPIRPIGVWLNSDGSRVLIGAQESIITEFIMTTPYDVSTLEENLFYNQFTPSYGLFSKNNNYDNIIAVASPSHKIQEEIKTCEASFPFKDFSGSISAYGTRNVIEGYTGAVIRGYRVSDAAEQDFTAAEITDGTLATFASGGEVRVTTWYDQQGSDDLTRTIAGGMPTITNTSGVVWVDANSVPYIYHRNTLSQQFSNASATEWEAPLTIIGVHEIETWNNASNLWFETNANSTSGNSINIGQGQTNGDPWAINDGGGITDTTVAYRTGERAITYYGQDATGSTRHFRNSATGATASDTSISVDADLGDTRTVWLRGGTTAGDTELKWYGLILYNEWDDSKREGQLNYLNDLFELGIPAL